ncbi:MAG: phosphodiester glycosidase family protein [Paenibacillus dendritiformis]|uniref:phosphodiester glycosidase family protein n=1 Tax=uncultured Paenibacillus sp. TaxID=227322 RepID=UPI002805F314|nr:phosphodiester glycosidase family protein [uncultured Paenibacillus sp.]MDU5141231.1 phosphodiester glycosidase family protein [Paenibacillus dendritiformis]
MAIQNGQAVRTHRDYPNNCLKNGTSTINRNRGTMYRTTGGTVNVKRTVLAKDLTGQLSNLKWAIGGISMHLDQTLTKAAYDKLIADEAEGVGGVSDKRPRTMMGYNSETKNIVLAIAVDVLEHGKTGKGITFYDGRTIMFGLGCTMAIHLDGGSSTSIRIEDQEDFTRNIVRHKVTDNAQLTAVYFDTKYGMQRWPSEWTDIWP